MLSCPLHRCGVSGSRQETLPVESPSCQDSSVRCSHRPSHLLCSPDALTLHTWTLLFLLMGRRRHTAHSPCPARDLPLSPYPALPGALLPSTPRSPRLCPGAVLLSCHLVVAAWHDTSLTLPFPRGLAELSELGHQGVFNNRPTGAISSRPFVECVLGGTSTPPTDPMELRGGAKHSPGLTTGDTACPLHSSTLECRQGTSTGTAGTLTSPRGWPLQNRDTPPTPTKAGRRGEAGRASEHSGGKIRTVPIGGKENRRVGGGGAGNTQQRLPGAHTLGSDCSTRLRTFLQNILLLQQRQGLRAGWQVVRGLLLSRVF